MAPPRTRAQRRTAAAQVLKDMPTSVLAHILLTVSPTEDLLKHVSVCARVHPDWRRVVMEHDAYGLRIQGGRCKTRLKDVVEAKFGVGGFARRLSSRQVVRNLRRRALAGSPFRSSEDLFWAQPEIQEQWASERARVMRGMRQALQAAAMDGEWFETKEPLMGDEGAKTLCAALRALPSPLVIQKLNLSGSLLTADGIAMVMAELRDGNLGAGLTQLVLWFNPVGDDGAMAIAAALPPTLDTLCVSKTECGSKGMSALAAALPRTQIMLLDCSLNPTVGDDGWMALGAALPQMATLGCLNCSENQMTAASLTALAAGLTEPSVWSLTLDLERSGIDDTGARVLADALPRMTRLKKLLLRGNAFGLESRAALRAAVAQHPLSHVFTLELDGDGPE